MPPERRHTVVLGRNASAGHVALEPEQVSCTSHSPPDARQTVPPVLKVQLVLQHDPAVPLLTPSSHCSPRAPSRVPLPHSEIRLIVTKWPSFAWTRPPDPG